MALLYKTVCVLVSGHIGSGKTLFSDMLVSEMNYKGWRGARFSFASGVKEIAVRMGWDGKKDERGRRLLQDIGMTGRTYNQDVWVSDLIDKFIPLQIYYPFDIIVIDDWRFTNEREYIEKNPMYDVVTLRIKRELFEDNNHISEHSLPRDDSYYSGIILNTGDMISLQRTAVATSEWLERQYNKGVK